MLNIHQRCPLASCGLQRDIRFSNPTSRLCQSRCSVSESGWSGRIRVYKNKPSAVRINTRIHADLSHICDKSSERFEHRQTTVCRLNMHVPNRKLKPPQMRRVGFSGRGERIRTFDILLPKQALYQTELRPE